MGAISSIVGCAIEFDSISRIETQDATPQNDSDGSVLPATQPPAQSCIPCYPWSGNFIGVGECTAGKQCDDGECLGAIGPVSERCDWPFAHDTDCDGDPDNSVTRSALDVAVIIDRSCSLRDTPQYLNALRNALNTLPTTDSVTVIDSPTVDGQPGEIVTYLRSSSEVECRGAIEPILDVLYAIALDLPLCRIGQRMQWRNDSARAVIVLTDEPPMSLDVSSRVTLAIAQSLLALTGVKLIVLVPRSPFGRTVWPNAITLDPNQPIIDLRKLLGVPCF